MKTVKAKEVKPGDLVRTVGAVKTVARVSNPPGRKHMTQLDYRDHTRDTVGNDALIALTDEGGVDHA